MSHTLAAFQERAEAAADAFCRRFVKPSARRRGKAVRHSRPDASPPHPRPKIGRIYRPRDHEASPFFKVVRDRFDEFERAYPERYQELYGYWRPIIRSSIDKFLKCGVLKEGFARVRCPGLQGRVFRSVLLPPAVVLPVLPL